MKSLIVILLFVCSLTYSQEIKNIVLDKNTKQPLEGVSVYFNETTIGTTTDANGNFILTDKVSANATLVISFVGYETRLFSFHEIRALKEVLLQEKATDLNEVVLERDFWSREKKLKIFRREFLGNDTASNSCKIINEDDIRLIYIASENVLYASCDSPILIRNNYLGYHVQYQLADFEIKFKQSLNGFRLIESVYYSGTSLFSEIHKKTKSKYLTKREKEYLGSVLHFMRSLSKKEVVENNFEVYIKDPSGTSNLFFPVDPYLYLIIEEKENQNIELTVDKREIVVSFDRNLQSTLITKADSNLFFIDNYGIFTPVDKMLFSGYFGIKRISTMLPADFKL
jgi:hypothetical protein